MESSKALYDETDLELLQKTSVNDPSSHKRNVRSQSCFTSSTPIIQRPQMRPQSNGDVSIIDLTSESKRSQRRSKSVIGKPPSESKTRRLSKYLQKHRVSVCSINSNDSSDSKNPLRKFSRSDVSSLQGCDELDETLREIDVSPPESLSSSGPNSIGSPPSGVQSYFDGRRGSQSLLDKRDSSGSISPGILLPHYEASPYLSTKKNPFVNYKTEVGDWRKYDLAQTRSSLSYNEKFDLQCKVVLLGDSGVGKTCLLMKFKDGHFLSGSYISTVGIDFRNKVVSVDGSRIKLQIWDTAGQERFRSVTHAYYRDAHALLLLYDVGSKTSFDNTRAWLAEVHEYAQDDVVIMLIANKCDTPYSERHIRKEDGERLAREYNVAFMETSAKTGLNVDLAFTAVARDLKARKSEKPYERRFNVSDYVQKEAKSAPCSCSLG